MGHPHLEFKRHTLKKLRVASIHTLDNGFPVFMLQSRGHASSKDVSKLLHTVADSQDGDIAFFDQFPDFRCDMRRSLIVDAVGSTTENDGHQFMLAQLFGRYQARVKLAVNVQFAYTTSNQVRILGSEIQNGHLRADVLSKLMRERRHTCCKQSTTPSSSFTYRPKLLKRDDWSKTSLEVMMLRFSNKVPREIEV